MITAKEAHEEYIKYKGYKEKINYYINIISDDIFKAATTGKTWLEFHIYKNEPLDIINDVVQEFRNNGFKVNLTECKTYHLLYILWRIIDE